MSNIMNRALGIFGLTLLGAASFTSSVWIACLALSGHAAFSLAAEQRNETLWWIIGLGLFGVFLIAISMSMLNGIHVSLVNTLQRYYAKKEKQENQEETSSS